MPEDIHIQKQAALCNKLQLSAKHSANVRAARKHASLLCIRITAKGRLGKQDQHIPLLADEKVLCDNPSWRW